MGTLEDELRRLRTRVRLELDARSAELVAVSSDGEIRKSSLVDRMQSAARRLTAVAKLRFIRATLRRR
jgi:hypothetical protein